jgi:hypothetical protein
MGFGRSHGIQSLIVPIQMLFDPIKPILGDRPLSGGAPSGDNYKDGYRSEGTHRKGQAPVIEGAHIGPPSIASIMLRTFAPIQQIKIQTQNPGITIKAIASQAMR